MDINYHRLLACLSLALSSSLMLSHSALAECTRSDVEYFLSKGFSQEQVVALCNQAKQPATKKNSGYQAYGKELEERMRTERRLQQEDDDIFILKVGIAAEKIKLTADWLDYQKARCLTAGEGFTTEARTKACPLVRYRIYFKGLEVKGYSRKYWIFGAREIEVVGKIKRKLMDDFKEYDPGIRRQLFAAYKALARKDGTSIPVRKDFSVGRIQEVLKRYAALANQASAE